MNIEQELKTFKKLEQELSFISSSWKRLALLADPFNAVLTKNKQCGHSQVFNTAGIVAISELKSYFLNYFTNFGARPIKLKPKDALYDSDDQNDLITIDERKIAERTENRIYQILQDYDTGVHSCIDSVLVDILLFANGAFEVTPDISYANIYLKHVPINQIFFTQDANCKVDKVFRKLCFTVNQLSQILNPDEYSNLLSLENINADEIAQNPEKKIELIQLIEPRNIYTNKDETLKTKKQKAFGSYYIHENSRTLIKEDGYDFMPIVIARTRRRANDKYGHSKAMEGLNILAELEQLTKSSFQKAELDMNPALVIDSSSLNQKVSKIFPGQRIYVNSPLKSPIIQKVYQDEADEANITNNIARLEANLRQLMLLNEIIATPVTYDKNETSQRDMTATEVRARQDSASMQLASMALQIEKELFKPLIDVLIFVIKSRDIIQNGQSNIQDRNYALEMGNIYRDIWIRYKQDMFNSIIQNCQVIAGSLQDTAVLQNIDIDKIFRDIIKLYDEAGEYMVDETTRDNQRKQIAQAQAQMAQQQQMAQIQKQKS